MIASQKPAVTLRTATRYQLNQIRYQHDPVGWIEAFVQFPPGERLTTYQIEVARALVEHSRASLRGPHGLGKTMIASLIILWFATTRDGLDWKVPTTASNWRQLSKYLWPEIRKWSRHVDWTKLGIRAPRRGRELLDLSLKLETGEAFAVASDDPGAIEGAHASHMLYLLDEAKNIRTPTWDAIEGAFSGSGTDTPAEALALAISTPSAGPSRFREIHERKAGFEDWWVGRVTLEDAISAGRISRAWAEQRARQWGEKSPIYITRVKGDFADQTSDTLIPLAWIEAAVERWLVLQDEGKLDAIIPTLIVGDIADGGADASIVGRLAPSIVLGFEEVVQNEAGETMKVTGRIKALVDAHAARALVDSIGVGAGVFSRLREQKVKVTGFNAGDKSTKKAFDQRCLNLRTEAWCVMRELLDPENDPTFALPPIDRMIGDLNAPRWYNRSDGTLVVESKSDTEDEEGQKRQGIRSRLKRSTDYGDVVVMGAWALSRTRPGKMKISPVWAVR